MMDHSGTANPNFRHGYYGTRTYNSWHMMIQRCSNPKMKRFKDYGGRGISVCKKWLRFTNFLKDMGERPEGKTIDREDNDGNYEPSNCMWSNVKTQNSNKRKYKSRQ